MGEMEGVPTWTQQLLLDGVILEDAKPLATYGHFEDGKATAVLVRKNVFLPADAFKLEPALGYIFRNGDQGWGYYNVQSAPPSTTKTEVGTDVGRPFVQHGRGRAQLLA